MKKYALTKWLFPFVIFFICSFIAYKNYIPETYLTGWDNLHPEFNFKLNIARSLNAAWQEYQGVGLLGGMAHAADLPRQILLFLVSLVLPLSLIRYFWIFLMLFIGPLGVYFLIKKYAPGVYSGAFAAAVFYIFNLATVQYFYVPFETFLGFYAFLPWLIWGVVGYIKSGKRKDLFLYFLISVIATSAFYVQTLFIVYLIFLAVILLFSLFKNFKINLKRSILTLIVTFVANAFWLLPVAWFSLTSGQIPINSEINRIASPETVYMNLGRSGFSDIVNLKGYWFDYYDFQSDKDSYTNGEFVYLFEDWIGYTNNIWTSRVGIALFSIAVFGLLAKKRFELLVILFVSYISLAGYIPRNSILAEAFRNSFTKWSVAFSFLLSLGIGHFVSLFKKASILPAVLVVSAAVYTTYPILEGKLVSQRVKYDIPSEYFEIFDWFNTQTQGERIAYFPAFDKWGWNYHKWGYGGSGFIWYGIKNPVLDRAFNVWSPHNEGFYKEVNKVIIDEDINSFQNTINKYQVKYLFLDDSVLFPWGEKSLLKLDIVKSFVDKLEFSLVKKTENLQIYDTGLSVVDFVSIPQNYTFVDVDLIYSSLDPIYKKYGNYVSLPATNNRQFTTINHPFVNFDPRGPLDIFVKENQLVFNNQNEKTDVKWEIADRLVETFENGHGYTDSHNCDLKQKGFVERLQLSNSRKYIAKNGGVACDYFVFNDAKYDTAYVLHIAGENKEGRSLKIYLYNWESKRVEVEELLPESKFDEYFVVYPKLTNSSGYTLNVETRSFGRVSSENEINIIEMIPFDYDLITNLYKDSENITYNLQPITNNLSVKSVRKWGTGIYKIKVEGEAVSAGSQGLLQLGQGYESGWIGLEIVDNRLKILEHVKINTWSNGWIVPFGTQTIYIVFWPQLLEWFGFLILPISLVFFFGKKFNLHFN